MNPYRTIRIELRVKVRPRSGKPCEYHWAYEVDPTPAVVIERTGWTCMGVTGEIAGRPIDAGAALKLSTEADTFNVFLHVPAADGFELQGYAPPRPDVRLMQALTVRPVFATAGGRA